MRSFILPKGTRSAVRAQVLPVATLLCMAFQTVQAQDPVVHLFSATQGIDRSTEKWLHLAVHDVDPAGLVSIDGTRVKVRSNAAPAVLLEAFRSAGLAGIVLERGKADAGSMEFPVKLNTGAPVVDDAAYQGAKARWIEAHPEMYQQLLVSDPTDQARGTPGPE